MRKVIGIGETVLDIIFRNEQPVSAVPGGSVYNGIISLGRAGVPALFISEVGNDRIGRMIVRFLESNGVDASAVSMFSGTKSPLSLAFLNARNDAEYIFYKDHPNDQLAFRCPDIAADDIVMLGSYYAINPVIRHQVTTVLKAARQAGAIVYYDVNYRASHAHEVEQLMSTIEENYAFADIVRGSGDDFQIMYGNGDADIYYNKVCGHCPRLIFTDGARPAVLMADGRCKHYPTTAIDTVSTIGAGDNFNAGLVYGLVRHGITRSQLLSGLTEQQWDEVIACAMRFSACCCQSMDNYISHGFAAALT